MANPIQNFEKYINLKPTNHTLYTALNCIFLIRFFLNNHTIQGINNNVLVHVIRLLTLNTYMSLHTYALLLFPDTTIHSNTYNCVWFTTMDFFYYIYLGYFLVYCQSIMIFLFFIFGICNTCFVLQVFVLF